MGIFNEDVLDVMGPLFMFLDPHRDHYRPDIFSFAGDKIHIDLSQGSAIYFNTIIDQTDLFLRHCISADDHTFLVYRIKLYQSEDLEEDGRAQCRQYTQNYTYKNCVLDTIEKV